MKTSTYRIVILSFVTLITAAISGSHAQSPGKVSFPGETLTEARGRTGQMREAAAISFEKAGPDEVKGPDYANIEEDREKTWNSPEMLSARAWLETYFERSAKISDVQAEKQMGRLKTMYPVQMKLWLLKFQAARESRKLQLETERLARHLSISMRQSSSQVGRFQNSYASRREVSSGQPIGDVRRTYGGGAYGRGANPMVPRQPVQKPFSSPQYLRSQRPIVTAEDFARYEILRGLGWAGQSLIVAID